MYSIGIGHPITVGQIKGHNECHITYILAASSPTYPIAESVYHKGWANSIVFKNGKKYYDITLPLGSDYGGPLFFTHYSYMGLDPRGLKDYYADYEEQMKAKKDPYYNPDKISWSGVDKEMWKDINKKYIENDK